MAFVSIIFWTFVISTANGLRSCEDCMTLKNCPQAYEEVKKLFNEQLKTQLINAKCENSMEMKICCSDFDSDERNIAQIEGHSNIKLLSDDCGASYRGRIIGGVKADLNEFPWLVLLEKNDKGQRSFYCGGSLISSKYVLTAAHCLTDLKVIDLSVRVGEYDLSQKRACYGPLKTRQCEAKVQNIRVRQKIVHPLYSMNERYSITVNDIALLLLKRSVNLKAENAGLICLPVSRQNLKRSLPGEIGEVAGWGWESAKAKRLSDIVLKASVPISSSETCSELYVRSMYDKRLFDDILCADEDGTGSCKGDSGGPLMVMDDRLKFVQYGIVSYGMKCGADVPSIYTDVTKHMKWILDSMKP